MTEFNGILELFAARRAAAPDRLFGDFEGTPITFATLGRQADAFAAALRRRGLAPGDRVAVMMRNGAAVLGAIFGMAQAGAVWVPVNAQQRGEGLRYILEHCAPRLVLADADLLPTIAASGADLSAAEIIDADALAALLAGDAAFAEPPPDPDACFAICYTSGTTGPPKGVMLSHRMLRYAGEAVAIVAQARDGDVFQMWEPLYHIGGMQMVVLPLIREARLAMVARFSASSFWQQVRDVGASHIHFLGGLVQILLKQPPGPLDRSHGARVAWGGGCPKDFWRSFEERFGIPIRECYGMTEASSITTCNASGKVGSVGRAMPWFEVTIEDETGRALAPGKRGEIVVRAPRARALTLGYFRNPEATAKGLCGGALHTGDLGVFDAEGDLTFFGRMTDSVRCRGENVSSWEVERVAVGHPLIEDCAMIGVAAEIGEQEIKLFVQPRPGAMIDPAALSSWLGERLAPYQNPRYIAVIHAFERTPSQRIMKHRLSKETAGCWDQMAGKR